jgi:glutathione S-transferase
VKISPLGKVPVLLVKTADGEAAAVRELCHLRVHRGHARRRKTSSAGSAAPAQHRAWMEFGSTILSELWGLETTGDPAVFETKRRAVAAKFAQVEKTLGAGPYFAGENFSLVDAVFAPIFRYLRLCSIS